MMRWWYRSLKYPDPPDYASPGDPERYRRENTQWWDNWSHNFGLSLWLLAVLAVAAVILVLVL